MLSESEIDKLAATHKALWSGSDKTQRPNSNGDIMRVWMRVCGDNTLEACQDALRRHAAKSKFPARPGDIGELLPARATAKYSGPTAVERQAYIDLASERAAELVNVSAERIAEAWRRVCLLLGPGGCEDYGTAGLDPQRYETLHPDLQFKLAYEAAQVNGP